MTKIYILPCVFLILSYTICSNTSFKANQDQYGQEPIKSGVRRLAEANYISKGIAESKSATTKDQFWNNRSIFGANGGTCKCGKYTYYVADQNNNCAAQACYGGESGQCRAEKIYRYAHYGVICNGKEYTNDKEEKIVWDEEKYSIKWDSEVVINWDHQTVCPKNNKKQCVQFASCKTNDYKEWVCIAWDAKKNQIHTYEYKGCHSEDGIGYCESLAKRVCSRNEGYFQGGPFSNSRMFSCNINGYTKDFDTCEVVRNSQVIKCCESHMNDDVTCLHVASDNEDFKRQLKLENTKS